MRAASFRAIIGAVIAAGSTLLCMPGSVRADYLGVSVPSGTVGNQKNLIVREDFVVPAGPGIYITNLASFVGNDTLGTTGGTYIPIQIWAASGANEANSPLVGSSAIPGLSANLESNNTQTIAGTAMDDLTSFTPVYLGPGTYAVIAQYSNAGTIEFDNGNNTSTGVRPTSDTGGGLIEFAADNGSSGANGGPFNAFYDGTDSSITSSDTWSATPYASMNYYVDNLEVGPTFTFVAAPEPTSLVFLGIVSAAALLKRRRISSSL